MPFEYTPNNWKTNSVLTKEALNNLESVGEYVSTLKPVAESGSYIDLTDKPALPGLTTFQLTIPTEGWSEGTPSTIFLQAHKLQEFNEPIVDVVLSGDAREDEVLLNAWLDINAMQTVDGGLMVYANKAPTVEIPIHLKEIISTEGPSGNALQRVILNHIPEPSEMNENKVYYVTNDESPSVYDQYVLIDGKSCCIAARVAR